MIVFNCLQELLAVFSRSGANIFFSVTLFSWLQNYNKTENSRKFVMITGNYLYCANHIYKCLMHHYNDTITCITIFVVNH